MPEFRVNFVEKTKRGVQVECLPPMEAYGELIDVLRDASAYAARHHFKSIRVYLHATDHVRMQEQCQRRFPDARFSDDSDKEYTVNSKSGVPERIDVYLAEDTAQPGNAMMILSKQD